jgi:peptidoglycan/xylan/chitin deacetylase (PgdA/CDA1 family)
MRGRVKAGVEAAVVRSGLAGLLRGRLRGRGLILAYHGIVPRGEPAVGERSLHVLEAQFIAQLEVLGELAEVVPLSVLLRRSAQGGSRPRIAITWDDAYVGALSCGVEAVVQRGFPATLFVAPGRLGGQSFWWDRLAERFGGMIPGGMRARALQELAGVDDAVAAEYERGAPPAELPEFARSAGETLLANAATRPGISVGSHSWSHVNLAASAADRVERELTESARWLGQRFASWEPLLAYPYGLHSPEVHHQAARAGYAAGFRIEGGWITRAGGDRFQVPRLNVPAGLSLDGFVLRLSGLLAR